MRKSGFITQTAHSFNVFSFELMNGNPAKALAEPYAVILTEKMAEKYFPDEDPIGKTININNHRDYKVTAIQFASAIRLYRVIQFHTGRAG